MPDGFARAEASDRHSVFDDVGNDVDFGVAFDKAAAGFLDRGPIQLAEAAAERDQLLVIEVLTPEKQHLVVQPGMVNVGEILFADLRQVDPADFGAQRHPCWPHLHSQPLTPVHRTASSLL